MVLFTAERDSVKRSSRSERSFGFGSDVLEYGGVPLSAQTLSRTSAPDISARSGHLVASGGPIREVMTFDLRQSMRNGGGPACLRLRVPLTPEERASIHANVFLDDALAVALDAWIRRNYRDRLAPEDLADPALLDESRRALDEISQLLRLGSVYPFQQVAKVEGTTVGSI